MIKCDLCDSSANFKNRRSLSAHKSKFHRNKTKIDVRDSIREHSQPENESDLPDNESNSSNAVDSDTAENESVSNHSCKSGKRSVSRNTIAKPKRTKTEYDSDPSDDDSDFSSYDETEPKQLNYDACSDNIKLLKVLCKSTLNGTIKLEDHHVQRLRPMKRIIGKIASENLRNTRKLVEKEITRDRVHGESNLCDILSTLFKFHNETTNNSI